jgi:hypothetical protein
MADVPARDPYLDRFRPPLTRGDWIVLIVVDTFGLAGLLTGALGPEWYLLTPWTAAIAYCAYNTVVVRREIRSQRTPQPTVGSP